ncbi:sigma-70 family RNA polymerase sigma factor [Flavobacterium rakeshii]|uniref:RNA polymerase sigma factor n=1 Tax=Flavobacterium rakeshii TaxID=1038845 RepID=UPI002E7B4AE6|nr:sigma-70 family RNA polymerase sigma factor [Flavobacterium rakeshii]MEE1898255.1 sigma-70 family RNA polymerase sigma factor [Flavobacterium rakeshii]
MDNSKLIKSLKKGNQKTFKEVYFKHYDKLIKVARRFEFKFLTPDDFVQETFVQLYTKRELLKEDVLFDKQLFVICKNIILNHLNRENKVIPLDPVKLKMEADGEDTDLLLMEDRKKQLQYLLEQLPEQQKKIFTLHKLDNYSYQEIAEMTKLSEKTIANHIYLANKFIQKKIAEA